MIAKRIFNKLQRTFFAFCRNLRCISLRSQLDLSESSVMCNNCIGAMLLHDLHEKFNSPTVNLYIPPKEYVIFLENLESNLSQDIIDVTKGNKYPIGLLNNSIHLHFVHYKSFNEAVKKWNQRKQRINYNNLFIVLIERDGCDYDTLERFDKLPFKHKVAIVHKSYPEIQCSYKVSGYESLGEVGRLDLWDGYFGKKYYDKIEWSLILKK